MKTPRITPAQRAELEAILCATDTLKRPTHLHVNNEADPTVGSLIRRGLIDWRPAVRGSGFGKSFRAVTLTDAGRHALGVL